MKLYENLSKCQQYKWEHVAMDRLQVCIPDNYDKHSLYISNETDSKLCVSVLGGLRDSCQWGWSHISRWSHIYPLNYSHFIPTDQRISTTAAGFPNTHMYSRYISMEGRNIVYDELVS